MMSTEEQYRQEWAVKSGRPASEVYVPEALRPFILKEGARVSCDGDTGVVEEVREDRGWFVVKWHDGETTHESIGEVDEFGRIPG